MPLYLSSSILKAAVGNLSQSAARGRYFEFLMLKRAFLLSNSNSVAFAEGDLSYKEAISELGLVASEHATNQLIESKYINIFDTGDRTNGYRSARFISNGPNTTVGGTSWQVVVKIDSRSRPRKVSLSDDYLNQISRFLLKAGNKPSFQAFAIWFCRHKEISSFVKPSDPQASKIVTELCEFTEQSFGLTKAEKEILFDLNQTIIDASDSSNTIIQTHPTQPTDYLPVDSNSTQGKVVENLLEFAPDPSPRNRLFFGSPGSGKSRAVRAVTHGHQTYTTTFHPDYEYADFVGAYKPVEDDEKPGTITYRFEPNILTNAYVEAWKNPGKRVYVVTEEINRGNCAQIFGDLFLLLDRDGQNYSDYVLSVGSSLSRYFNKIFHGTDYEQRITELYERKQGVQCRDAFSVMAFPPNLYLYATMNTSDQSLFPMDSAFKRRWDWEYIPIDYADACQMIIEISPDFQYNWGRFIECINQHILELTDSEDKQLGNRFVSPPDKVISISVFKSKVLYYLWSEIYKNERNRETSIFQYQPADMPDTVLFSFSELYELTYDGTPKDLEILPSFMRQLGFEPIRNR